jgi:hypothetical protein
MQGFLSESISIYFLENIQILKELKGCNLPGFTPCSDVSDCLTLAPNNCTNILAWNHDPEQPDSSFDRNSDAQ